MEQTIPRPGALFCRHRNEWEGSHWLQGVERQVLVLGCQERRSQEQWLRAQLWQLALYSLLSILAVSFLNDKMGMEIVLEPISPSVKLKRGHTVRALRGTAAPCPCEDKRQSQVPSLAQTAQNVL